MLDRQLFLALGKEGTMADKSQVAVAEPETEAPPKVDRKVRRDQRTRKQPRFNVILWDDDDHSYDYVMRMMQDLFRHPVERSFRIALEVDLTGRAICLTTTKEHAELKRDQIHAFGKDALIDRCCGSMKATIEPSR